MTTQKISSALRAVGFQPASYDSGKELVACVTGSCVEWIWSDGQQVAVPKGAHRHSKQVRPSTSQRGFQLLKLNDGSIAVRGVDPLEVRNRLAARGFDVVLKEKYGWQAYSDKVQYEPAVVVGYKEVR